MKRKYRVSIFMCIAFVIISLFILRYVAKAIDRTKYALGTFIQNNTQVDAPASDKDTDKDGLSDYQEIHKYFTNPKKKDSDNDGIPDGDWNERREYTYTIIEKVRIVRPWNTSVMNDDYQDVRVIKETKDYLDMEVVFYPLNTNSQAVGENKNWKKNYKGMTEYLKPGITTNWDEKMRQDLIKALNSAGIDPDKLSDKELVLKVSKWIWKSTKSINGMPLDFAVYYKNRVPVVYPELKDWFNSFKPDKSWTDSEVFNNLLLGKQMFYKRTHGSCSSSAILQATIFKALGIPTRIISMDPALDGNDSKQLDMMFNNLTNYNIKNALRDYIPSGFANHFYNEVFVGGRWVRLNYDNLGANTFDENYMGLQLHIDTFSDLSDIELAKYWGMRLAGKPAPELSSYNPYQMLEIKDCFGKYSNIDNPVAVYPELKEIHVNGVYMYGDSKIPSWAKVYDDGHYLVLSIEDWLKDKGYKQLNDFEKGLGGWHFLLKAEGYPDIEIQRDNADFRWSSNGDFQAYGFKFTDEEWKKIIPGVKYTIYPINNNSYKWTVKDGVIFVYRE